MAYTPTDFFKGSTYVRATSWSDHYSLIWDGYTIVGAVPTPPATGDVPRAMFGAKGDLVAATANGLPARFPVGADGLFLKADSSQASGLAWATASAGGILASLFDAKGDLLVGTADDALARFPAGSNGQVLTAQSGQSSGLQWATLNSGSVGLGSVDNTADTAKPVSTAQQTALNLKANLANPTFTGTVGGVTAPMVGLGSVNNTADSAKPVSTAQQTALNLKVDQTTTVAGAALSANVSAATIKTALVLTATDVGLGSVNNTADSAKPVSTAQQTALNAKADLLTSAVLTAAQTANTTVTPVVLTGHTFVIPPGKTLILNGQMIFQSAATTTGAQIGIRVTQPASASATAVGSFSAEVALAAGASAAALRDGGSFAVAANTNTFKGCLGTGVSATGTDHVAVYQAVIKNQAAAHSTTVTVEFASEVAASGITPQAGTSAAGVLV